MAIIKKIVICYGENPFEPEEKTIIELTKPVTIGEGDNEILIEIRLDKQDLKGKLEMYDISWLYLLGMH